MLNISTFTKTCKKYAKNKNISNEDLLNGVAEILTVAIGDSYNYHIEKNRVSEIMNNTSDLPKRYKKRINDDGIIEFLNENVQAFLEDYISEREKTEFKKEMLALLNEDNTVSRSKKEIIRKEFENEEIAFVRDIFIECIKADNKIKNSNAITLWENGVNSVNVLSGDIFNFQFGKKKKYTCITVIPVNTSFDTHVSRNYENGAYPLVSEKTLHGQWLYKIGQIGTDEDGIYEKIITGFKARNIQPIGRSLSNNAKTDCYPVGTVAVYEHNGNFFYLTAVSGFNENNNAHSSAESIEKAFCSVLKEYNESGQGYDLYIPLIGTGRSRAGLSNQESFDLIIKCLKNNTNLIQGKLTIVIRPEDFKKIKIGW